MADERRPTTRTLASEAYDLIQEEIRTGRYRPGERLRFATLQALCVMSVTPVREALARLTAEGFTTLDDHRGYSVAVLSIEELRDLTANRKLLEGEALRLSVEHGDADWEGRLVAAHHMLARIPQARDDIPSALRVEWEDKHRAFHATLISGCGSPILIELCGKLFSRADRYRRMSASLTGGRDVVGEHRAIFDAALARDAPAAADLLRQHYQQTADALERFFVEPS
ncbi:FCD domain-containing protein [Rhizobium sp. TRM95111]|uniref:GntR family transcriptional regulator n=1 Tax=Rhizobium alarense TaxID=2846851 RepID=UPI001F42DE50|nr:FCD domain-containing protein [Rhizobium alarense]MCF3638354.1 FCD domain-containing protein [Rhizobium alarense]